MNNDMRGDDPIISRPSPPRQPIAKPPATASNPSTPNGTNLVRAVLYSVSPTMNNPTTCSVLLNNRLPERSGYSLPAGCGQFYAPGATITLQGATVAAPGPFTCDPSTKKGGTFVLVDTQSMAVVQVLQGVSQSFPSSAAMLVATHKHTGGQDPNGNPLPEPIDLTNETSGTLPMSKVAGNPAPTVAPTCSDAPLHTPTYPNITSGTNTSGAYDAEIQFDLTQPTGYGNWLAEVRVFAILAGTVPTATMSNAGHKATLAPTTGSYTAIVSSLPSSSAYDLYACYVDGQGVQTPGVKVGSTVANPIQVGNTSQLAYPGGAAAFKLVVPVPAYVPGSAVMSNANTTTFDAQMQFTTDANGYVNTSTPTSGWLAEIQLWAQAMNSAGTAPGSAGPFQAGVLAPAASGTYTGVWPSLGNGTVYQVFVRYVDYAGNYSALSGVLTTVSSSGIGPSAFTGNPNKTTAPAYATGLTPVNNGGSPTDATFTYIGVGNAGYEAVSKFTLTVTNPPWLKYVNVYTVQSGTHAANIAVTNNQPPANFHLNQQVLPASNGAYILNTAHLAAGASYDIYIGYLDLQGNLTPLTLVGTTALNNLSVGPGSITTLGGPNLVVDSDFIHVSGGTPGNDTGSSDPYWQFYWIDGLSFYIGSGQGAQNYLGVRPADSSRDCMAQSQVIPVEANTTYTVSGYIDATKCTGAQPAIEIISTDGNTIYKSVPQTLGTSSRVSGTWSCPGTGVTQVCVRFRSYKTTVGSSILVFSTPMFQAGLLGPYTSGPSTPQATTTTPPSHTSPAGDGGTGSGGGPADPNDAVGAIKHPILPTVLKSRVLVDGTLHIANDLAPVTGNLPLANHDATVQTGAAKANTAIDSGNVVVATAIDFTRAYTGKGALATKSSVDLSTGDVVNKTASNITYTGGATVDSLKPAQAGADVTGSNTAADTAKVNGVTASSISPIATLMPAQAGADKTSLNTAADTSKVNGVTASSISPIATLMPAEAGAEKTTGKSIDILADGATYARVKATELATGTVKQLNDGTNIRTAGAIANTLDVNGLLDVSQPQTGKLLPLANHDAAVTNTLTDTTDIFGSNVKQGALHAGVFADNGQPGATNILSNPTGTGQSGAANYVGWNRTAGATPNGNWTGDAFGGGRFLQNVGFSLGNNQYDGWEQPVTLFANQTMSLQAILDWGGATPPAGVKLYVDIVNAARSAVITGSQLSLTSGMRVWLPTSFSTGSNTSGYLRIYAYNTSGATQTVPSFSFSKIQLEYATAPTPFVDHLSTISVSKNFDGGFNMRGSTPLIANIPNITTWRSNAKLWITWTSGQSTAKYWLDDGSGNGVAPTVWNSDSTTLSGVAAVGGASFNAQTGGVTMSGLPTAAGSKVYFCVYFQPGSGWQISYQTSPFAINSTALATAYKDGGYLALFASTGSSGSFGIGTSGGTQTGGGGGRMTN